ncbi:hypothetical protein BST81_11910 [Leptolyngbya sp. 'hensonii']|uniref:hypothetical protein n=1 Tax=Leptolyngbya sp. 'hensonii' TaxID=1922337 RepID=UPI000950306E|nr:hypothetical protein [Leptolyngbya sp. 'hensonii']OLP17774.1 hypothetical protein BST81_11910 [Leptolyngbya sp. 'hensonii']
MNLTSPRLKGLHSILDRLPLSALLTGSSLALITYITRHGLIGPTIVIGATVLLFYHRDLAALLPRRNQRPRSSGLLAQGLLSAVLGGAVLLDGAVLPAQAQFMNKAEQFFDKFTSTANIDPKVTDLVFSTLRGLFLLYLSISLIRVVQAARNDEDWQTLARTPLIIVITIVVADVLTGLVTG